MSRAIRIKKGSHGEFYKLFLTLCESRNAWEVWTDFITMCAVTIANATEREGEAHDNREKEYMQTIKKYREKERDVFPKLFAMMVNELEKEPEQDFLGEMFMLLDLGNHWKGQFFTPYFICRCMAEMTIGETKEKIEEQGWASIMDCCCGAGALLIAVRNKMVSLSIGPNQALYVAQDIDRVAAMMCYVQLSLLGCAGYVVVSNALLHPIVGPTGSPLLIAPTPDQEVWVMPALYHEVWYNRIKLERLRYAMIAMGVMENPRVKKGPQRAKNVSEEKTRTASTKKSSRGKKNKGDDSCG